jgi:hypothetical protein
MRPALAVALTLTAALDLSWAPLAGAADREACFSAAESAQKLRTQGHLREARDRLLVCAQPGCPAGVQSDCTTWLTEVGQELPSIVVQAHDAVGNDLSDVHVLVDGTMVTDHLDGRPLELDPGSHALRLERNGAIPVERSLVLVAGQKARIVEAQMVAPEAAVTPVHEQPSPPIRTTIPMPVLVLGAVGAAGLVSTAIFWAWGRSEYSSLKDSCSPACDPSTVSSARTKLVVGDVSLGVAVIAIGVGAWLFLTRKPDEGAAQSAAILLQPQRGGGVLGVQGRF